MLRRHWNNQKCGFPHANEFLRRLSVNWPRALKDVFQPLSRERQISNLPWAPTYLGPALYEYLTELVVGWPEFQNKGEGGVLYLYDDNCFKFLFIKMVFKMYNTCPVLYSSGKRDVSWTIFIDIVVCDATHCTVIPRLTSDPANEFFG